VKRSQFFAVMGKSLLKTVQEASTPLIIDQVDKLDSFADDLAGVEWHEIGTVESLSTEGLHDLFVRGNSITVMYEKGIFKAVEKVCLACKMMPQWISYEKKFKCLNCGDEYYVPTNSGKLHLKKYPLKMENKKLYIGLN
jgi:predicted RNA-binding Zn-ribbon protein involved in translation (DUF1610 family)